MTIEAIHATEYTDPELPHSRIRWTPESTDLHLNLVNLRAGEEIGKHTNISLDVVLTCLDGGGTLVANKESIPLRPGSVVLIPKGSSRAIIAGPDGLRYTTCHQKRGGLMPTVPHRPR
jgi:quercetin dioxygenase-like cupin family protein